MGTKASTGDIDSEDLGGVCDGKVADPLGQERSATGYRMLGGEGALERAPLGVREAHEDAVAAGVRKRRPTRARHVTF